ncbi:MAG: GNAT family N-acetyltransferase [bacterium]|nr:N-acetyltransferase [Gammaproteobacteria bacterium]HIL98468.1 N-acetyltransferase [Pseudomonadales bacterium]
MDIEYTNDHGRIDWEALKQDLIADDFHNGRTARQLRLSFENSKIAIYVMHENRCIATARALSDGVCNCYVVDVWTQTNYRNKGIASEMMRRIINQSAGQHIYLQTDDAVPFYEKLGFKSQPEGLSLVSGEWLVNETR